MDSIRLLVSSRSRAILASVVLVVAAIGFGCRPESPAEPAMGAGDADAELASLRERMVERLRSRVAEERLLEAMGRIPRHEFVAERDRRRCYEDVGLPLDEGQSMYGPSQVARIVELLDLDGSEKVLDVGTGSGYLAALLGELAAEVWSVEIKPALQEQARDRIEDLTARGVLRRGGSVHLILGDGSSGHAEAAPFDAIVLSVAPRRVPEELLGQLRPGGRLVIPVGKVVQKLQVITRRDDGSGFDTREVGFVRFDEMLPGGAGAGD